MSIFGKPVFDQLKQILYSSSSVSTSFPSNECGGDGGGGREEKENKTKESWKRSGGEVQGKKDGYNKGGKKKMLESHAYNRKLP